MHIVFAASECVPYSKTGGLADVVGALPRAVAQLGHQATVYLPFYRQTLLPHASTVIASITIPFDDRYRFCSVVDGGLHQGVQYYFIAVSYTHLDVYKRQASIVSNSPPT